MSEHYNFEFDEKGVYVPIDAKNAYWHYHGECLSLTKHNAELLQKVQQLEEAIKELIIAINDSNFCTTCSDEFGTLACSECPWHQAKEKAIRLLAKEEK